MGIDWLGVAAPIVGNVLGGFLGQSNADAARGEQYKYNRALMEYQHALNLDDYRSRYYWAVEDLRNAHLNPILAATNGIGGSINGTGLASSSAVQAPTPDFASAFSSAYQISSQKEIAKMQNAVAKEGLVLEKQKITNAKEKQDNDIKIDNARFDLEKMVQEASVKRADALNDATIQNMKDRLEAEKAHWERMDLNGSAMAAAAMQSANAAGLQAAVAAELGISRKEVMQAEQAYIGLQSANAEEALYWQKWLNDHPYTRGAVGFLGAIFDTVGLGVKASSIVKSGVDLID